MVEPVVEPSTSRAHVRGAVTRGEVAMVGDSLLDLAERVSWRKYEIDSLAVADAMMERPRVEKSISFARSPLVADALR